MGRAGLRPRKAGGGADTNLNTTTFNLPAVAPVAPVAPAPVLPPVPPPPAPVVAAPTGGAAPGPITADEDGDEDQQPEEEEHDDDDQVVVPGGDAHGAGLDDDDSQRPGEAVGDTADGGGDGADLAGDGLEERGAGVPGLRPDDAGKDDPGSVDDDQAANPDDEDGRPVDEGETIDEEAGGVDLAGSSRKRRSDSGDSPESDRSTKSARISLPAIPLDRRPETWLSIREWFENDGGDPDDMDNLFSRLFVQADDEGLRIPDPPGYALFEGAPALYLDRLTRFVRTQILEWCNNSFANAITRSKDMRERLSYEQDQQNMQSHFEQGGWPWRADRQVVPLDEDAPPRPAGDPRITAERLGFGTDLVSPGKRGIWSLRSSFPAGTWCHAGLWVKTRKGRIVDRSVVKEVYLTRAEWRDNNLWENVNGTAWPMEAVTQWRLVPCEESFNVVKYAAHSTGNQMYRIYQEYCPCGNLETMIELHKTDESHISPHVLWAVFEALASAACLLSSGKIPTLVDRDNWTPLIHSDIKPANIFLAFPNTGTIPKWPGIPIAKLGDFGGCHYHDAPESVSLGTLHYMAPERGNGETGVDLVQSDIWSIGRLILSLMNRDRIGHGELDEDEEGSPIYKDGVKEHYFSLCPRLVELVDRCLNYDPAHRPSAQQLWQDIRQQVGIFRSNELLPLKLTEIPGNQAQPLVGGEGLMGFASDRGDSGGPDDGEEDDDEQDDDEQNDNGQNVNEGTSEEENDDDDEDLYGE